MEKESLRPLQDRILVRRQDAAESVGGIFIPEQARERVNVGLVVAVGKGKVLDNGDIREPAVSVGDKVLFGKFQGQFVKMNQEELLIVKEDDIYGIIE